MLCSNHISELNCTVLDYSNDASVDSSHCTLVNSSFTKYCTQLTTHNLWTLYFDSSKNIHGVNVGYLLVYMYGIQTYFSYHLEFECTNNDVEYQAAIQGLKKEIDLNVKCIEVFGDSQVVIRQVRDSIHCTSHHLKNNSERYGI